ncbi:MAG: hypothetical protein AAF581_06825 [Planctomycetota bacterium]
MTRQMFMAVVVLLAGCVNSPGWPERDGAKRLRRAGYDGATITKIIQGRPLPETVCHDLESIRNQDVGFLLARNPHLGIEQMTRLSRRKNDFVRAGLARNPSLTAELIDTLRNDSSHTVWIGLAANPSLETKALLELRKQHGLDWSWFAMNPACPAQIVEKIRHSGDKKALYWLDRTKKNLRGWPIEKPQS